MDEGRFGGRPLVGGEPIDGVPVGCRRDQADAALR
jgi:hypothetical protein